MNLTKTARRALQLFSLAAVLVSAAGCFSPLNPDRAKPAGASGGSLRVSFDGLVPEARSLRPDLGTLNIASFEVSVTDSMGSAGPSATATPVNPMVSFSGLAEGYWTVAAVAYDPLGNQVLQGTAVAYVSPGMASAAMVPLSPPRTAGGEGTFTLALNLENLPGTGNINFVSGTLTALAGPSLSPGETFPLTVVSAAGTTVSFTPLTLPSGDYKLDLLYDDTTVIQAIPIDPVVKIYDNLATAADWTWNFASGALSAPLSVYFTGSTSTFAVGTTLLVALDTPESLQMGGMNPVAIGKAEILSDGSSSVDLYVPGTSQRFDAVTGTQYFARLIHDANNNYSALNIGTTLSLVGIFPHHGDSFSNPIPIMASGAASYPVFGYQMQGCLEYAFLVSPAVTANSGQTLATATTWDDAVTRANSLNMTTGESAVIYLSDSLDINSSQVFLQSVTVRPLGASPVYVYCNEVLSPPIVVGDGTTYYPQVTFERVVLDGSSLGAGPLSGFRVNANATLNLRSSTVQNFSSNDSGGGVYLDGGLLKLEDSVITNCSAQYGGAIYAIGSSGRVILGGGNHLSYNTVVYDGGAVFIDTDAVLELNADSLGSRGDYNTANGQGGGLYVNQLGILQGTEAACAAIFMNNSAGVAFLDYYSMAGYTAPLPSEGYAYVSLNGTGTGTSPSDPASFFNALESGYGDIILTEDLGLNSSYQITSGARIRSMEGYKYSIYPASPMGGQSLLTISGESAVTLENVAIGNAAPGGYAADHLIYAPLYSTLTLAKGSEVRNNASALDGGGVYAVGATVVLKDDAQIFGCDAPNGGGIALVPDSSPASLHLLGGSILSNHANGAGGGVYVGPNCVASFESFLPQIAYNRAESTGGGIFFDSGIMNDYSDVSLSFLASEVCVVNNQVNDIGGI